MGRPFRLASERRQIARPSYGGEREPDSHPTPGPPTFVQSARVQDVRVITSAIGTVLASNNAVVRPQVSGVLQSVHFREGQQVVAGQLLAQSGDAESVFVDPEELERGYLFTGDLVIWQAPNCGNPQKVQRFPAEWAAALRAMPATKPRKPAPISITVAGSGTALILT